jgi:NADPH-dependent 2,4-dienoyl-CoA reductase/sulfur reductase-like enzyme
MTRNLFDFEIVVVGAGPAGLAAACAAAETCSRVALVDETPWLGGQIWRGQERRGAIPQAQHWLQRFRASGVTLLDRTTVVAAPSPGTLLAEHDEGPRLIKWDRLILATGARELFLPFPGWTLPGVMGAGGLQSLVKLGWPIAAERVLIAGSGPLLLAVAAALRKSGACILSIAEQTTRSNLRAFARALVLYPAKLWQAAQLKLGLRGVPYRCGVWPLLAEGDGQVRRVTLTDGTRDWTEDCDLFACGFGLVPNVELPLALGCELEDGFVWVDAAQCSSVPDIYCAGEPTGIAGADCALVEGQIAGYAAAANHSRTEALFPQRAAWHRFRAMLAKAFALRPELRSLATGDTLVCRCEDVPLDAMRKYSSWREAKLLSRCGMGACQGRICGAATSFILGWGMESVRPPILPARVKSLISAAVFQPCGKKEQPRAAVAGEKSPPTLAAYSDSPRQQHNGVS